MHNFLQNLNFFKVKASLFLLSLFAFFSFSPLAIFAQETAQQGAESGTNPLYIFFGFILTVVLIFVYLATFILRFVGEVLAGITLVFIRINPSSFAPQIEKLWSVMVNFSNLILLSGFIYLGVSLILKLKSSGGDTIKKFATNLVIVAVTINFSLAISSTVVNLAQTAGDVFLAATVVASGDSINAEGLDLVKNPQEAGKVGDTYIRGLFTGFSKISTIRACSDADLKVEEGVCAKKKPGDTLDFGESMKKFFENKGFDFDIVLGYFLSEIIFGIAMALLFIVFWKAARVAVFRLVWLIILMITSPLALVGYLSPVQLFNEWGNKWRVKFITVLPLYPLVIISLYFATYVIQAFNVVGGQNQPEISKIIDSIFVGLASQEDGAAGISQAVVSLVLFFLPAVLSLGILWLLMDYLDKQYKEQAPELARKAGSWMAGTAIAATGGLIGGTAGLAYGLWSSAKGRGGQGFKQNLSSIGEKINMGSNLGGVGARMVADGTAFKAAKQFVGNRGLFGIGGKFNSEKGRERASADADVAMRKAGFGAMADSFFPKSDYLGTQGDQVSDMAFKQNAYQAQDKMDIKMGRTEPLSKDSYVRAANTLAEELKENPKLDFNDFDDRRKKQTYAMFKKTKDNAELKKTLVGNPKLVDFFAKSADKITEHTGDEAGMVNGLISMPAIAVNLPKNTKIGGSSSETIDGVKGIRDQALDLAIKDPVKFVNENYADLKTAQAIDERTKDYEDGGGGSQGWRSVAGIQAPLVPPAPSDKDGQEKLAETIEEYKTKDYPVKEADGSVVIKNFYENYKKALNVGLDKKRNASIVKKAKENAIANGVENGSVTNKDIADAIGEEIAEIKKDKKVVDYTQLYIDQLTADIDNADSSQYVKNIQGKIEGAKSDKQRRAEAARTGNEGLMRQNKEAEQRQEQRDKEMLQVLEAIKVGQSGANSPSQGMNPNN